MLVGAAPCLGVGQRWRGVQAEEPSLRGGLWGRWRRRVRGLPVCCRALGWRLAALGAQVGLYFCYKFSFSKHHLVWGCLGAGVENPF